MRQQPVVNLIHIRPVVDRVSLRILAVDPVLVVEESRETARTGSPSPSAPGPDRRDSSAASPDSRAPTRTSFPRNAETASPSPSRPPQSSPAALRLLRQPARPPAHQRDTPPQHRTSVSSHNLRRELSSTRDTPRPHPPFPNKKRMLSSQSTLPVPCWLLAVPYWLPAPSYRLPATGYRLLSKLHPPKELNHPPAVRAR